MLRSLIIWILKLFGIEINSGVEEEMSTKKNISYTKKSFMSPVELQFYQTLLNLKDEYNIVPQINLATIIKKNNGKYITELFRNIDFAIFDKDFKEVLLLIELNDSSHEQYNRKDRDLKVKKICNDAGIKLITFHTKYPNESYYVINRIRTEINKEKILEIEEL